MNTRGLIKSNTKNNSFFFLSCPKHGAAGVFFGSANDNDNGIILFCFVLFLLTDFSRECFVVFFKIRIGICLH